MARTRTYISCLLCYDADFILDENNAEAFLPDDKICLDLTVFHDELVEDAR